MSRDYAGPNRSGKRRRADRWPQAHVRQPKLACVKPVPGNRLTLGAVVWAHVPFEDCAGEKTRPAVIVAADRHTTIVLPGSTSRRRLQLPQRYHELTDPTGAGLSRPTGIRLSPTVVDRLDLVVICGELSEEDLDALTNRIDLAAARQLLGDICAA